MATKKTTTSKTAKKAVTTKKAAVAKKATPAKKAAPAKKVVASKITTKKAVAKKAAPAKKATPAKKAAAKKVVAAKKSAPAKKVVASKKAAPVKKAAAKKPVATKKAPAKKAVAVKKAAPVKKAAAVKKAAPVKKAAVAKKAVPVKKTAAKKAPAKKTVTPSPKPATQMASVRPEIVDAVRTRPSKTVTKPGVVIAHRDLKRKKKEEEPQLTMTEYTPEKRSILQSAEEVSGPVYRYSDEELNEFKELIAQRLENARKELTYLQGLITRKDEAGTDDTDNRFNHMEDGSGAMEREQLSQLAGRQIQFINHLEKAMIRIENKTYGICRVTGKLIDKKRLRAVPHATLSIEAKTQMNK